MSRNYNPSSSCRRLLSILSPPPPYCCYVVYVYMHHKKIPFSADQKHGNIFPFSRILTSNIYALSLNPQKSKKNLRGLLEKRKKTIKKMCLMKKFTICWCLEEKKVLLKMEFFLPCSRATSSEEQKCLKKVYGKNQLWKKQTRFICYCWLTYYIFLIEKNREEKNEKKLHEVTSWRLVWWTQNDEMIYHFHEKKNWKNHFTKKMRRRSHYWCQRPCERRRWKDMFKTCRICTTMKIHSEKAKFQSHSLSHFRINLKTSITLLLSLHYYYYTI